MLRGPPVGAGTITQEFPVHCLQFDGPSGPGVVAQDVAAGSPSELLPSPWVPRQLQQRFSQGLGFPVGDPEDPLDGLGRALGTDGRQTQTQSVEKLDGVAAADTSGRAAMSAAATRFFTSGQ